jgi:3-oxoadipate enol-lactonase
MSSVDGFIESQGGAALVHFIDLDLHAEALHLDVDDPVVLIHGLGCNWRHWSRQIGWLAHARRVVAVDMRGGAGRTRCSRPNWTTADMAADAFAVVAALGLRRPAVVGISMGGTIALQYALDHPDDISRLVIVDSLPGISPEMAPAEDAALAFIDTHTMAQIAEERIPHAFTPDADPAIVKWIVQMIASGDIQEYRQTARATWNFDVRTRLKEIAVPTTVIHGEKDPTVPVAIGQAMAEAIPNATLHVLKGQGHFPHLEAPAVFDPILAQALGIPEHLVPGVREPQPVS